MLSNNDKGNSSSIYKVKTVKYIVCYCKMYNRERNTIKIKVSIDDWLASRNTERTPMNSVEQMPDLNQEEELKRVHGATGRSEVSQYMAFKRIFLF